VVASQKNGFEEGDHTRFQTWIPAEGTEGGWDIGDICRKDGGLLLELIPDGAVRARFRCLQLVWDAGSVVACHITDETYRPDCWSGDLDSGRFYISRNSEYLERLACGSPLIPQDTIHFLLIGTNTVADVLARETPAVRVTV